MKIYKLTLLLFASSILFSACTNNRMDADNANKEIQQAVNSYDKVNAVGFAWRDTQKMIKKAKEALADDDVSAATKHAKEASMQNKLAMEQYEREKNAGPH